ncbi:histidine kinase [Micromonospora sp. NPDC049559]|uniref:sensor histidine kinase n=1 Tax=Micromonospora sp. NPDC049559 TaxID=3155923 RepID=UPI0034354246
MTVRLPRLPGGPLGLDIALAVASFAGGLLLYSLDMYLTMTPHRDTPAPLFLVTLAAACVAVGLRRLATRSSLAIGTVAVLTDLALGASLATALVYTQVLYDACVYGSARMWRRLLGVTLALTGVGAVAGILLAGRWQGIALAVLVLLVGVLPVVTGISVRQYRDQAVAERARAEQTARLAELDRRQAVSAERNRMARELHDVIANHLSAVAIHATAVLSVPSLQRTQVEQALRVIRENSVQGLAEMRQMIGLLREPPGPVDGGRLGDAAGPGPVEAADEPVRVRLAELDRLLDAARDAGLPVRLETTGAPRPLPASVDLAAYRIVQESLTNALKHGAGPALLDVHYDAGSIRLTVENPLPEPGGDDGGSGPGRRTELPGSGAGLVGMRERASLLGGRFDAGPLGRRWRVSAELPTTTAPAR